VFRSLSKEDLKPIASMHFNELASRLEADHGIALKADDQAITLLAEKSWNPAFGARGIRRQLQELVESPLAKALLAEEFKRGDTVNVSANSEGMTVTKGRKVVSTKGKPTASKASGGEKAKANAKSAR